jgi:hypothetical protein
VEERNSLTSSVECLERRYSFALLLQTEVSHIMLARSEASQTMLSSSKASHTELARVETSNHITLARSDAQELLYKIRQTSVCSFWAIFEKLPHVPDIRI